MTKQYIYTYCVVLNNVYYMSGERQHIIPRFLLKGFALDPQDKGFGNQPKSKNKKKKSIQTWKYEQTGKIYKTNINDVSVERHFYGSKKEISCDDKLTSLEPDFAKLIDGLRKEKESLKIKKQEETNHFIYHLIIRNKNLRVGFTKAVSYFLPKIFDNFIKKEHFDKIVRNQFDEKISKYINIEYEKRVGIKIEDNEKKILIELATKIIENPRYINALRNEFEYLTSLFLSYLQHEMPGITKESHNQSILEVLEKDSFHKKLQNMTWFLVVDNTKPLILGDVGVLGKCGDDRKLKPFLASTNIEEVYLPISSSHLIVGSFQEKIPEVETEIINTNIAQCSQNYFVASSRNSSLDSYSNIIGKNSEMITKEEMNMIVSESVKVDCQ